MVKSTTKGKAASKKSGNNVGDRGVTTQKPPKSVALFDVGLEEIDIPIIGETPMLQNTFPEKARKQIRDSEGGSGAKTRGKDPRVPFDEFCNAFHLLAGTKLPKDEIEMWDFWPYFEGVGFPASGIKKAMVGAGRQTGDKNLPMTKLRGAFQVVPEPNSDLVPISFNRVEYREDVGKNPNTKGARLIYRPAMYDWSAIVRIRYNKGAISPEYLVGLLNLAGFSSGLGEWRPEKDGTYGMFHVNI